MLRHVLLHRHLAFWLRRGTEEPASGCRERSRSTQQTCWLAASVSILITVACAPVRASAMKALPSLSGSGSVAAGCSSSRPGRPGDVHVGHALGSACHHAGRIERHAQVPGLGLQERAGELAQSGAPASAASRMTSMSTRAR